MPGPPEGPFWAMAAGLQQPKRVLDSLKSTARVQTGNVTPVLYLGTVAGVLAGAELQFGVC